VPSPSTTRPGASAPIDAIAHAVTGAIRVPAIATPVPSTMRLVATAAAASAT
jgi:hypothetical protein